MLSCLGFGKSRRHDHGEREPLLPQYHDDTPRQARLHEKIHSYQMLRAMSQGYMPSNEQAIVHLRSLLSANLLNPDVSDLSTSGRALVSSTKLWITQLIDLLEHKNPHDQVQDFIWYMAKARLDIDVGDIGARAAASKAKADASATVASLKTIGSLLLTNSEFRLFLADLSTIGREVFRDAAFTLADVSRKAGDQLKPSEEATESLKHPDGGTETAPSDQELEGQVRQVAQVVSSGAAEVVGEAGHSLAEHVKGDEQQALIHRLKQAVLKLRKRPDYSESASTLSLLLQRYLVAYTRLTSDAVHAVEDEVGASRDADKAVDNFWQFLTTFGDREQWGQVEKSFKDVVDAGRSDPDFDKLAKELANLVQEMLTEPDFFDNAEERLKQLRARAREVASRSSMGESLDGLLKNLHSAIRSVRDDEDIEKLFRTSTRIAQILSPSGQYTNSQLVDDSINVFIPLLVQGVQHLPVPRLEVSTPDVDLLLENLVLEPGKTVNHSSFLPYRLQVSTHNDIEVRKARFQTTSSMTTQLKVRIAGLSLAAADVGYWVRLHSGLLRTVDEGLVSFYLDERGIDIALDIEIGRDRIDQIVSLRRVGVRIHHLNYTLSQSKFSCLAWLFKPLIRPLVRKALEGQIAAAVDEGLRTLNRELLYARERLRATRIADPESLVTFVRAVAARLTPAPDPDLEARAGVRPGRGVFRGRYAPGSLVKLWDDEGREAEQRVFESGRGGWRNGIFDVGTRPAADSSLGANTTAAA
ncbi:Bactericidal permeability-increasing protein, alpha/beta domain [Hirsutella rhossiliensis]|uniref:Bactericidal permeability-increasing protein, alpha/beta domain n=1 Tax=Hirsutella rhossiliensis TaxID=111463 RepID=A0A9P8MUJ8_9HYPO|nr:Bactericidal permeability-increasing protein, alpha/beta domain [Hirsutella rhossiliensis]KAH0961419.1 Bactericidal permeability-increasing protein, alpha/beta domain [Hirsutella rhossiliensis]